MNIEDPGGATAIDPDEARALIPAQIATQAELNEWEHENIVEGERWAFGRRRKDILTMEFLQRLHRKMFGATWRWAGRWRTTEKNIGIAPERIPEALRQLFLDVEVQLDAYSYPAREIAARLHHRLVQIHPFPADLVAPGQVRERYIGALRAADLHDYQPMFQFLEVQ